MLKFYPTTPTICTIHSEVIDLEHPVLDEKVLKYICIRPEIKEFIVSEFGVSEEKTAVIYNPFDSDRFKPQPDNNNSTPRVLFVGTIDHLRKEAIEDLISRTKESGKELWILGKKREDYLDNLDESHVKYFEPTWNVENYIRQCDETAGILLGRTTIEGWLCGKPGWIYDVDSTGNINSVALHEVPTNINKFKSENIMTEIITVYEKIL